MKKGLQVPFYIVLSIGALWILMTLYKLIKFIIKRCFCRSHQDLMAKYGERGASYAVVTGGNQGFGIEFCRQLAAQGFNICMISRNKALMDAAIKDLRQSYPNIQAVGVQSDLAEISTQADYNQLVAANMAGLDIALLVLNAGVMQTGIPFDLNTDKEVESVMRVNGLHVVYLAKALVNQMRSRDKRSGLVIVSSGLANASGVGIATYCATKALVSSFGVGIHYENKDRIDVLVWEAGPGQTNLGQGKQPPAAICRPVPEMVAECLLDLGREIKTSGVFKHELMTASLGMFGGNMFKNEVAKKRRAQMLGYQGLTEVK